LQFWVAGLLSGKPWGMSRGEPIPCWNLWKRWVRRADSGSYFSRYTAR
jgi:hypothetical protein